MLHWAAFKRHEPIVVLALELGADPNQRDSSGVSPVWRAAWSGTAPIMRCDAVPPCEPTHAHSCTCTPTHLHR